MGDWQKEYRDESKNQSVLNWVYNNTVSRLGVLLSVQTEKKGEVMSKYDATIDEVNKQGYTQIVVKDCHCEQCEKRRAFWKQYLAKMVEVK
jgi:hypothetical protein